MRRLLRQQLTLAGLHTSPCRAAPQRTGCTRALPGARREVCGCCAFGLGSPQVQSKLKLMGIDAIYLASSGERITRLDQLQDIDELYVVEVRQLLG